MPDDLNQLKTPETTENPVAQVPSEPKKQDSPASFFAAGTFSAQPPPPEPPPGIPQKTPNNTDGISNNPPFSSSPSLGGQFQQELTISAPPKKSRLKIILVLTIGLLILISVPVAVYLTQQRQEIRERAYGPSPAPHECPGAGTSCQGLTGTHCNTESCCEHTCQADNTWGPGTYCGTACQNHPQCQVRCGGHDEGCPYDVTGYVERTGTLPEGYALCNNEGHNCITLNLPPEYQHCTYLGEIYTDGPQDCGNTEAHKRWEGIIGHGDSVCFPALPYDGDCKVQLDIRYNQAGAPAGNIKTYKIDCNPPPPTQTPPPSTFCRQIKAYKCGDADCNFNLWNQLDNNELANLRAGERIILSVIGEGPTDGGRFRINGGNWIEASSMTTYFGTREYYIFYTIPSGVRNFTIEAEVRDESGQWH